MKQFYCNKHPEVEAVLISGNCHCPPCSRELDREVLIKWAIQVKPALTRKHAVEILGKMFGTPDFGFSTFPVLYDRFPRKVHKRVTRGSFGFVVSQLDYFQEAFLSYCKQ
jgi:hypothetical protein